MYLTLKTMSNNKQTAVEWLIEQIKDYDCSPISNNEDYAIVIPIWILKSKVQQAKAMHKEEIMDAWYNGFEEIRPYVDNSEQYYNETYEHK